ncbi:MAG: hypothetical protein LBT18_00460 [Endomicrobium sp.]|nr:hypothetical protein [Endomicrobium sp.]
MNLSSFLSDFQEKEFDFIIFESLVLPELTSLSAKINSKSLKSNPVAIIDYENPISEVLKKENILLLQKPFNNLGLFRIMES